MSLLSDVSRTMLAAAKDSLGEDWGKAKDFAEPEFKRLARSLVDITKLIEREVINKRQAKALLQIHRNTTQIVLLTIEGFGLLAVENAINAALKSVTDAINSLVGFKLV